MVVFRQLPLEQHAALKKGNTLSWYDDDQLYCTRREMERKTENQVVKGGRTGQDKVEERYLKPFRRPQMMRKPPRRRRRRRPTLLHAISGQTGPRLPLADYVTTPVSLVVSSMARQEGCRFHLRRVSEGATVPTPWICPHPELATVSQGCHLHK